MHIWNISELFLSIIYLIHFPLIISFEAKTLFLYYNFFITIFIFFGLLINLNTGFYYQGNLITNRKQILNKYISNELFIDLITLTQVIGSFFKKEISCLSFLYLFRALKIPQKLKKLEEENFKFSEKSQGFYDLFKLFFYLIFTAHTCGCIWHFIGRIEIKSGIHNNWITTHELIDSSDFEKYIEALFFSVLTMSTVGILSVQSTIEKSVSIIMVLVLAGVFAYYLNSIGNIFDFMSKNERQLKLIIIFNLLC